MTPCAVVIRVACMLMCTARHGIARHMAGTHHRGSFLDRASFATTSDSFDRGGVVDTTDAAMMSTWVLSAGMFSPPKTKGERPFVPEECPVVAVRVVWVQ